MTNKEKFMSVALSEAEKAYKIGEIPIGAVVVKDGEIISAAHNRRETGGSVLYHAELIAIHEACKKLGGWRLHECELYVTLEPCIMCSGAISQARIKKLYFGASDPNGGAVLSKMSQASDGLFPNTDCEGGVLLEECSGILKKFFRELRSGNIQIDK